MPPNTEKTCLLKMDPNGQQLLVSQFQDYLVNGTFTDMSVCVVQDTVKYTIRCHRAVLASACPFLADLLRQDSDEETALGKDTNDTFSSVANSNLFYIFYSVDGYEP